MITPQDIRDKTFEKAIFGGYDMGSVDDFLDKVAGDLAASQKEILVLRAKMKVLVDKVEEYRSNEDALNMALLSAQKLSVQIEAEARHKADVVVAEANTKAQSVLGGIAGRRAEEEARLADAQQATTHFIGSVRQLCNQQVKHLDALSGSFTGIPEARTEKPAVAQTAASRSIDETVRSIEDSVARIQAEPAPSIEIDGIDQGEPAVDDVPAPRPDTEDDDTQLFTFHKNG
jgi:cell division initiation protein